jgi:hypothetical protein
MLSPSLFFFPSPLLYSKIERERRKKKHEKIIYHLIRLEKKLTKILVKKQQKKERI